MFVRKFKLPAETMWRSSTFADLGYENDSSSMECPLPSFTTKSTDLFAWSVESMWLVYSLLILLCHVEVSVPSSRVRVPEESSSSTGRSHRLPQNDLGELQTSSIANANHSHHSKRSSFAFLACLGLSASDDGNHGAHRDPGNPVGWGNAPEWYVWVRSKCVVPHYSGEIEVTCKKIRSRGLPLENGIEIVQHITCPVDKTCLDRPVPMNGRFETGEWGDVICVGRLSSMVHKILASASEAQAWCSVSKFLGLEGNNHRTSWQLTLEIRPDEFRQSWASLQGGEMWFEIESSWWKYRHRLPARTDGSATTAVVNTAPALGRTSVRFCVIIAKDTIHKAPFWVAVLYSYSLVPPSRRHGGPVLDVDREPIGSES